MADAPTFLFEEAFVLRSAQAQLRHRCGEFRSAIQTGFGLTEDVLLGVAMDALGVGVPRDDEPAGIEHHHGVVDGFLRQQPQPLATQLKFFLQRVMNHADVCHLRGPSM